MSQKQFKYFKLAITIFLAISFSYSVMNNSYAVASLALAVVLCASAYIKSKVRGVSPGEKDIEISNKASKLAMVSFVSILVIISFVFIIASGGKGIMSVIGPTLAFVACGFMLLYAFIYAFMHNKYSNRKKIILIIYSVILVLFFLIGIGRVFGGDEDYWKCEDGKWVAHGMPSYEMPTTTCYVLEESK